MCVREYMPCRQGRAVAAFPALMSAPLWTGQLDGVVNRGYFAHRGPVGPCRGERVCIEFVSHPMSPLGLTRSGRAPSLQLFECRSHESFGSVDGRGPRAPRSFSASVRCNPTTRAVLPTSTAVRAGGAAASTTMPELIPMRPVPCRARPTATVIRIGSVWRRLSIDHDERRINCRPA
jgi:hypothetical protein